VILCRLQLADVLATDPHCLGALLRFASPTNVEDVAAVAAVSGALLAPTPGELTRSHS